MIMDKSTFIKKLVLWGGFAIALCFQPISSIVKGSASLWDYLVVCIVLLASCSQILKAVTLFNKNKS